MANDDYNVDAYFCMGLYRQELPVKQVGRDRIEAYNLGNKVRTEWDKFEQQQNKLWGEQRKDYRESERLMSQQVSDDPNFRSDGMLPVFRSEARIETEGNFQIEKDYITDYLLLILQENLDPAKFPKARERVGEYLRKVSK